MASPRSSRALQTALICERIAAEKFAVWRAELRLSRSAVLAARRERAVRTALGLDKIERQTRRDERVLRHLRALGRSFDTVTQQVGSISGAPYK